MARGVTRVSGILLLLILWLAFQAMPALAAQLVTHPTVPVERISSATARMAFTMKLLLWPDGTRVKVFVLPDGDPVHRDFVMRRLDLYPRQLRRAWDRRLYSGTGAVPTEVASVDEMRLRLAETPGGIGYLPEGFPTGDLRVLHVD
jgi:hypothetical protein